MSFLSNLWEKWNRIAAPADIGLPVQEAAPLAPLASEPCLDVNTERTQLEDARHEFLAGRICAINNANVVRDYGPAFGVVDESYAIEQLDKIEEADIKRLITMDRYEGMVYGLELDRGPVIEATAKPREAPNHTLLPSDEDVKRGNLWDDIL